jgi:hypothetical protein
MIDEDRAYRLLEWEDLQCDDGLASPYGPVGRRGDRERPDRVDQRVLCTDPTELAQRLCRDR